MGESWLMAHCITCGTELHPERAQKYNYCTAPECQEKNLKGLTIVAVGMNKAADEFLILDEQTRDDLASGKYRDLRKGWSAPPAPGPGAGEAAGTTLSRPRAPAAASAPGGRTGSAGEPGNTGHPARRSPVRPRTPVRPPWTQKQQRLALLYNSQGLRPAEIASKLGLSSHLVTQIILAARNRGKA
jgi:hypothetical protein